jgi:hypothetical protein
MCLDTLAKKPKKHKVGYKLFSKRHDGMLGAPIFNSGPYEIGKLYDANFESMTGAMPMLSTSFGSYQAGFHYYLKMKDAKRCCSVGSVVIRIKVKNVLATGTQSKYDAGVSQFMTLDRSVYDGDEAKIKNEKRDYKKFLNLCKGPGRLELLKFAKKFKLKIFLVKPTHMKELADVVSKNINIFADFISFVDYFPTQGFISGHINILISIRSCMSIL